ncbi:MAG: ABC transporter substrate-binding protein [Christensenellales bacterium]|jgi:spermidine/putrescine transport system substrate-binding protein
MKKFLSLALVLLMIVPVLAACGGNTGGGQQQNVTLNVLNWGDYIEDSLVATFEDEYPWIKVNYQDVPNNEEMMVMLDSGGYDVAFPSDYIIERLIANDSLAKIDTSKLENFDEIMDFCKDQSFDPGNQYSVPYMWGTLGILYNTTMVDETVDSWEILWDEAYEKQIFMYDSIRDSIAVALMKNGYEINTRDEAALSAAEADLVAQKPLVLAYVGDEVKDKMIGNNAALAVVYSGDAAYCIMENEELSYAIPKEGSNLWFDNMVIMKDTENYDAAMLFIDFLCRPDIALINTNYIGYTTPVQQSFDEADEILRNNPAYNPSEEALERCEIFHDLGDFIDRYNDIWMKVKATRG